MRGLSRRLALTALGVVVFGALVAFGAGAAGAKPGHDRPADRVVMFASDGMRPDLMEKYAKAGAMPTYKKLMKDGVTGDNGMLQAFPPNTGVGWYTMATGTYPSEHGSTNNTYFRGGDAFANRTSFSGAGMLQADTIANAAERAGKKVAQIDWVGGAAANINGPTVDFTNFFSNRGVLVGAGERDRAGGLGLLRRHLPGRRASPRRPAGASVPPAIRRRLPKETTWTITSTFAAQNPNRDLQRLLLRQRRRRRRRTTTTRSSARSARRARRLSIDLKVGDFLPDQADGRQRPHRHPRRPDRRPLHQADLARARREPVQALRHVARPRDREVRHAVCDGLPAGGAGEDRLEKYIADNLLPVGRGRLRARGGRRRRRGHLRPAGPRPRAGLQPPGDQLHPRRRSSPTPTSRWSAIRSPTRSRTSSWGSSRRRTPTASPNPCYDVNPKFDDVQCTGRGTARPRRDPRGLHPQRLRGRRREARHHARADGRRPDDVRRLRPRLRAAVLRRQRERRCSNDRDGRRQSRSHASDASASNCSASASRPSHRRRRRTTDDLAKACWAGGTIQIYVNPTARRRPALPTYEEVRTAVAQRVPEPDRPGEPGQAGHPEDHEQGGAAERRRLRLAAPEPQRRRRRRARARRTSRTRARRARRSRCRTSSGSTATCRTRRPEEQHQHARDVRAGRPAASRTRTTSRACGRSTSRRRSRS